MRAAAGLPLLGAAGVLVTVSVFFGGGSGDERLFWIGAGAVAVTLAATAAALWGALPWPRLNRGGIAFLTLLVAFVVWNGLTIWWSIAGDRSWEYLNRGVVYVAFAVIGVFTAALLPRPARGVAGGLALLLGAALVWALAGKVVPALFPDGARVARLRNPVGYWNALALLGDVALPLFLWLSARRRELAALGVYVAIVAILLTYSRAGVAVGVVAVALWLWLGAARRESLRVVSVAVPVALGVSGIALALPGVSDDLQRESVRVRDGAWFGLALVVGAAVTVGLARRDLRRVEARALAGATALLVAAGIGALAARGGWLEEFRGSDGAAVTQGAPRLASASSNNRWTWWQEAWQVFEDAPAQGKGAGTFEIARRPLRKNSLVTTEPHNVALQALSETGIFGFLFGGSAALAGLLAAGAALQRLEGGERAAAAALAIAAPAYLLHALADIDWDFVAASAPLFLVLGVLIGAGAPLRRSSPRPLWALGAVVLGFAAIYSLTAPWLADRDVAAAYDALARDDVRAALSTAQEAHDLNPLSVDPLWALAAVAVVRGDQADALFQYERAAVLQHENSSTWYELGAYELRIGRLERALRDLDIAYSLDPYGPAGRPGGLLDQVRARLAGPRSS